MPYAIVVNVPEAKESCFVALPFDPAFDPVLRDIKAAASDHGLRVVLVRSGVSQPGVFFTNDIVNAIRSTRVVVAVCSPEEATGKANPNVLYELGLAHALGKATVILTSDLDTLPANLSARHALVYGAGDVGSGALSEKISKDLENVLRRMQDSQNPLTDPDYLFIYVAHERHLMFHNPEFWDHFRRILSFANLTRNEHHQINTGCIDSLLAKANRLWSSPGQGPRVTVFLDAWEHYCQFFQSCTYPRVYRHLEQQVGSVDAAFTFVRAHASPELKEHVDTCDKFYGDLRTSLFNYPQLFKDTKQCVEDLPQDPTNVTRVFTQVRDVYSQTKSIVTDSDGLMFNLIEMIRTQGE